MNRRAFFVLLCAIAIGCAVSTAQAGGRGSGYTGKYSGKIIRIIGNTIQVEVVDLDKIVSFWTDQRTKIKKEKMELEFSDLKVGQTVTVEASRGRAKTITVDTDAKTDSG